MPHIHLKIDFTVEVFIVYQNKVLLRKHDKYKIWLSVGGHIELDEDPMQAAVREVKEEVGLDVKLYSSTGIPRSKHAGYHELIPPQFMNRHSITETHEHVSLIYFATAATEVLILSATERSAGCKWFSMEELDAPEYGIRDEIKTYAKQALRCCRIS